MRFTARKQTKWTDKSHWTKTAIECYKRGCVCKGCQVKKMISEKCLMKYSVIRLVREIGRPTKEEINE